MVMFHDCPTINGHLSSINGYSFTINADFSTIYGNYFTINGDFPWFCKRLPPVVSHSTWPLQQLRNQGAIALLLHGFAAVQGLGLQKALLPFRASAAWFIQQFLSGWWLNPTHLKNMSQLGWWHSQLNGKIKVMFQTTNNSYEMLGVLGDFICDLQGEF